MKVQAHFQKMLSINEPAKQNKMGNDGTNVQIRAPDTLVLPFAFLMFILKNLPILSYQEVQTLPMLIK
jgi:hypothetical protein